MARIIQVTSPVKIGLQLIQPGIPTEVDDDAFRDLCALGVVETEGLASDPSAAAVVDDAQEALKAELEMSQLREDQMGEALQKAQDELAAARADLEARDGLVAELTLARDQALAQVADLEKQLQAAPSQSAVPKVRKAGQG